MKTLQAGRSWSYDLGDVSGAAETNLSASLRAPSGSGLHPESGGSALRGGR